MARLEVRCEGCFQARQMGPLSAPALGFSEHALDAHNHHPHEPFLLVGAKGGGRRAEGGGRRAKGEGVLNG